MRVGFLIDRWQPSRGGAERALARLAAHLEGRGHEVLAFGLRGPLPSEPAPGSFRSVTARGLTRGARERRLAEALLAAAEAQRCDVTIGARHLPRVDVYWPHGGAHVETLAVLGKRVAGRQRAFVGLERELLEHGGARAVVCVSRLVQEELERHYPACVGRLALVPNGVDRERFAPRARAGARERLAAELGPGRDLGVRIAFVGRNAELKGLDLVLEALSELRDRSWTLVAAGVRRPAAWQRAARRAGIGPRVHVREWLADLDLAAGADLSVLPTRRDPCPLSVLEALACGTPVIASARAGSSDVIRPGRDGEVLAEPEDVGALRGALEHWIDRVEADAVDAEDVSACVSGRGVDKWLARLEQVVLAVAERRAVP